MDEENVCNLLKGIDRSILLGENYETQRLLKQLNTQYTFSVTKKKKKDPIAAQIASNLDLDWLAQVIRDKGLRFRGLEKAIGVDQILLKGNVDVSVKHNLLKAIKGEESLDVDIGVDKVEFSLTIRF